jgi:hypothetical protein
MLVINNLLLIQPLFCGEILSLCEKKEKATTCRKDVFLMTQASHVLKGKKVEITIFKP